MEFWSYLDDLSGTDWEEYEDQPEWVPEFLHVPMRDTPPGTWTGQGSILAAEMPRGVGQQSLSVSHSLQDVKHHAMQWCSNERGSRLRVNQPSPRGNVSAHQA